MLTNDLSWRGRIWIKAVSISVKKVQVAWRVTRDTNLVHVQLSYAKSHISWMGNDGNIIGAVVGHPVFNNGKVRLIFFMKTCIWKIFFEM